MCGGGGFVWRGGVLLCCLKGGTVEYRSQLLMIFENNANKQFVRIWIAHDVLIHKYSDQVIYVKS